MDVPATYAVATRPPLVGDVWLNAPAGTTRVTFGDGHVYLVEFTAHWCAPCGRALTPIAMRKMLELPDE